MCAIQLSFPISMPVQVAISDRKLAGLSEAARDSLKEETEAFANEVVEEAKRLEGRVGADNIEITARMVGMAAILVRSGGSHRKKSKGTIALNVVGAIFSLVTGVLADFDSLKEPVHLTIFVFVICFTILILTIAQFRD